jgi:hypothetical protein
MSDSLLSYEGMKTLKYEVIIIDDRWNALHRLPSHEIEPTTIR